MYKLTYFYAMKNKNNLSFLIANNITKMRKN